ncbi:hypothetical protein [Acaryochloris sp. CCMEE 5410]|uniref:hypothetical protein n=1 Tax=Acaryochloris sp. CCMEE 5410 TaxID=310037 RepID=UPI001111E4CF|nr:hypothetical protein [Acaryochloris sp. CCMEE 5410]
MLNAVKPWPQPNISIGMNEGHPGEVIEIQEIPVILKNFGSAQLWWGEKVAVLWEAFFDEKFDIPLDSDMLLNQLWQNCESFLAHQGVRHIYTYNRDPRFETDWYQSFLKQRGYQSVKQRPATVCKLMA